MKWPLIISTFQILPTPSNVEQAHQKHARYEDVDANKGTLASREPKQEPEPAMANRSRLPGWSKPHDQSSLTESPFPGHVPSTTLSKLMAASKRGHSGPHLTPSSQQSHQRPSKQWHQSTQHDHEMSSTSNHPAAPKSVFKQKAFQALSRIGTLFYRYLSLVAQCFYKPPLLLAKLIIFFPYRTVRLLWRMIVWLSQHLG